MLIEGYLILLVIKCEAYLHSFMCKDRLYFVMPTNVGNLMQGIPYSSYRLQLLFGGILHCYWNGQGLKRVIAGFDPQTHTISHTIRCVPTDLTGWDAGSSPAGHQITSTCLFSKSSMFIASAIAYTIHLFYLSRRTKYLFHIYRELLST